MSAAAVRVEEVLESAGVMDDVRKNIDVLKGIVTVVKTSGTMDKDTMIYRLAMTIYHSKALAGKALIESMEDPGSIYLKLINNQRVAAMITEISNRYRLVPIAEHVKTLIAFLIAAYVVHLVGYGQ